MNSTNNGKKRRIMIITADETIIEQIQNSNNGQFIESVIVDPNEDEIDFSDPKESFEVEENYRKKSKNRSLSCVVCGAKALGYNFDAITCESCKAFFRRNALKDFKLFQCRRNQNCEITIETRRRCSACRLTKCLDLGMKTDRLLTVEERAFKRQQNEQNKEFSLCSNDEKPKKNYKNQISSSNLKNDFNDPTLNSRKETRRPLMTTEDLKTLEFIQNSYDRQLELAVNLTEFCPKSTEKQNSLVENINSHSVVAMRLLLFFKQIPEFNSINVDDKVSLIKLNLLPLVIINESLSFKAKSEEIFEVENDFPWNQNSINEFFGDELTLKMKKNFHFFFRIAQFDRKIILLALVVLIFLHVPQTDFNVSQINLKDPIAAFQAQNFYAELIWKYLETVHGIEKATRIFQKFIFNFLSWKTFDVKIRQKIQQNFTQEDFDEILPIMKSLIAPP